MIPGVPLFCFVFFIGQPLWGFCAFGSFMKVQYEIRLKA